MKKKTDWLDNAVFYEIYPQSFMDTNGDGIGDIRGIKQKLDYIKSLGCNAIWINPCYASAFTDAGYDISDYYTVAPRYGTNDDLKHLFQTAHEKDVHIILDLVPGHTSLEHPWFIESMKAEKNKYTDRYIWTDDIWKEPAGFSTIRGISPRSGSCVTNFFSTQPALNYGFYEITDSTWQQPMDAPGPRETFKEMLNVMRFWLDLGADGFRIDMAGFMIKNDPQKIGTVKFWQEALGIMRSEYPDAKFVAEWGEPENALKAGFDMDFFLHCGNTHYMDLFRENPYFSEAGDGDLTRFIQNYQRVYKQTNGEGLMCMPSGNHDLVRISKTLSEAQRRLAFAFILTLPGAPFIYYGDEIGMKYLDLISHEGGYHRTGSRTPMQWDESKNSGFSSADDAALYLPMDPDPNRPTAKAQMADPASLWHEIKKLIEIRMQYAPLQSRGKIEFIDWKYPLVYRRSSDGKSMLIVINPKSEPTRVLAEGKIVHTVGGRASIEHSICKLDGCTAVIIEE